jgi:hypothetical protein
MNSDNKNINIKENPKPINSSGKGMSPIKGYNYKKYSNNYDYIFRKTDKKKDKII